jgi:hypothetical protein
MPELVRLEGLLAKIESVYKTDPTPVVGTDGVQVEETLHDNTTWGYVEENLRENLAGVGLGRVGSATPTGRWMDLEVTTALKGTLLAYATGTVVPEYDVFLRACALQPTVTGSAGAKVCTYTLRSSGFESATVWAYSGGKLFKVNGCRGNARFLFTPGQIPRAVFSLRGFLAGVTQVALPTITYAYEAVTPPTVKGAGLSLNSVDPAGFDDFELDLGIELADLPHGNDTDGFAGVYVTDYNPMIKTTIERGAISTFDPWALRHAGTLFAWDIGPVGATQYNRVTASGPKGRIIEHSGPERDGMALTDLTIRCQHTDAETEDSLSIVFD